MTTSGKMKYQTKVANVKHLKCHIKYLFIVDIKIVVVWRHKHTYIIHVYVGILTANYRLNTETWFRRKNSVFLTNHA